MIIAALPPKQTAEVKQSPVALDKEGLRRRFLARRRSLNPEEVRVLSEAICAWVRDLPYFRGAGLLFTYVAFRQEVDPAGLMAVAWEEGKRVAVPRVDRQGRRLVAVEIRGWEDLSPGTWGILEPGPEGRVVAPEEIDLALVPGVAFDRRGYRLGYGGGYYDRFLPLLRSEAVSVGLAYGFQIADSLSLAVEPTDVPVHFVATEQELIRGVRACGAGG